MTASALAARVKATGQRLGFDLVAIGPAAPPEHGAAFEAWLEAGHAGAMGYLERGREKRLNPSRVLPGARSIVACALGYYQGSGAVGPEHVARYAWGRDYHEVMQPRLRDLLADIVSAVPDAAGRVYVDTGPLLERDLAARAGLGWVGKNTMLLHPRLGSFFFIGVVLTTAEIEPDRPLPDRCGTCTRCLDACPTGAFVAPYVLDARRCVSYLTIEQRGPIPGELREGVGMLAFGCDICQDVCPWNGRAPVTAETAFLARDLPTLTELVTLSEAAYRERLPASPLRRARRDGLARNAAVALGNGGEPDAVAALAAGLAHVSPLVRAHAAWSLGRRGGHKAVETLEAARAGEGAALVIAEIDAALASASSARPRAKIGLSRVGSARRQLAEGRSSTWPS